jgi:hypothetical protein
MGKSALLGAWAVERSAVRHFAQEGDLATCGAAQILENLCLQLAKRSGSHWQPPPEASPRTLRAEFDSLLASAAEQGAVDIVLDGLDEDARASRLASGRQASEMVLPWLPDPSGLPPGVALVVSTRPELLDDPCFRSKLGRDKAEHVVLGRLAADEVRAVLFGVHSKYEVLDSPGYVEVVVARSEGSPLYLRLLAEDLVEQRLPYGDTTTLPLGVVD